MSNQEKSAKLKSLIIKASKYPLGLARMLAMIGNLTEITPEMEGLITQLIAEDNEIFWIKLKEIQELEESITQPIEEDNENPMIKLRKMLQIYWGKKESDKKELTEQEIEKFEKFIDEKITREEKKVEVEVKGEDNDNDDRQAM
jgi:hypothetical protein